ncbi:DNA polymerase III subunit beta [Candidatus Blochmanniella vafra str. BVAF]|uniref:Beta sliding clamp n=1 Tax=Blochmanniella vafra (strain BVAF) TaxID=859654 RepID=E8Q5W0_BLOVB|nr:DNA polymerase III subunit beta [Candidatus Blochmannia vafer]ADV33429.1 DNA polymerase III subunit beta [Candidatus Blochmannia vafer str. BVAF]
MTFCVERQSLYPILQKIISVVSNRPRLPILKHILLEINNNCLILIVTNLEVEIIAHVFLEKRYVFRSVTVSGIKLYEIFRNLSACAKIFIKLENNKLLVNSGCSSFVLSTLPASDFPNVETLKVDCEFNVIISQLMFKKIIELTQFAMGYRDARHYLNGIFFEIEDKVVRVVATDGHRLAMCEITADTLSSSHSIIIPRQGIVEILRLLNYTKNLVKIKIYDNRICVKIDNYIVHSKLIDSVFPNYKRVLTNNLKLFFEVDRIILKQALKRVSILSNEKLRVVHFNLMHDQLKITANNFKQETSEEILEILYDNENIGISFNVDYILDIINVIDSKTLKFFLTDPVSSVKIEGIPKFYEATYVVMPVRA